MNNNKFLEQSRRDNTHNVQLTPHKAKGRNVGMIAVILLVLSMLATACSKPEKKELVGTWKWGATTGGIGGWCYTPVSEGFEAEIVFKGNQFTFYKNGEKVTSGTYHIDYDVDETFYTNKGDKDEPFYSWFNIRFNLTEAQCRKMSEATNGKISLCADKFLAAIGYSEEVGQLFTISEYMFDGFCYTFVKEK